ncbi:MAG TPA: hypothetical protein VMJ10_05640 [Kofleriaceae bacterium]|nr:hypothetical protein [Kofleriaceae bacterium]
MASWRAFAGCAVAFLYACGGGSGARSVDAAGAGADAGPDAALAIDASCATGWTQDADDPVIAFRAWGGAVWNDPWVIKDGATYRMWLSNGAGSVGVSIYEATSSDGASWTLTSAVGSPELAPGPSAFDQVSVETPSVVKLGATYHMFWTAVPDSDPTHYTVGHATSPDGVTWVKDAQPAIDRPSDPTQYGGLGVAEPAAVVFDNTIYLYYAAVRCRNGVTSSGCAGPSPVVERAIALATSSDGVTFTPEPAPVLLQSASYPAADGYEGYSTPAALARGGGIELYYDVVHEEPTFRQVALAYATSSDGLAFSEAEPAIVERDPQGWTAYEVRAPTAVDEGDHVSLWFAGNNGNDPSAAGFEIGIGHARSPAGCP